MMMMWMMMVLLMLLMMLMMMKMMLKGRLFHAVVPNRVKHQLRR